MTWRWGERKESDKEWIVRKREGWRVQWQRERAMIEWYLHAGKELEQDWAGSRWLDRGEKIHTCTLLHCSVPGTHSHIHTLSNTHRNSPINYHTHTNELQPHTNTHTQNKMKEGSINQEHLRYTSWYSVCAKIKTTSTSNAELVKDKREALPHHLCFPVPLAFQWGWL